MIIETGSKKLPVRYGWSALAKFGDSTGKSMDEVLEMDITKMTISELLEFIFIGFTEGARKAGQECVVKDKVEVGDMMDDDPDLINKVMDAFAEMSKNVSESTGDKKK